ncbi:hypothetical protein RRG08_017041 [Elysia crispata]|uniref:Uncharacterized protein n=1 Tax=Elysia crispata TaxID=231223 RepID=A0AAE0YHX4_9GAST|nr:hypothetical protein RRG08_017041 [Elysia crispata]
MRPASYISSYSKHRNIISQSLPSIVNMFCQGDLILRVMMTQTMNKLKINKVKCTSWREKIKEDPVLYKNFQKFNDILKKAAPKEIVGEETRKDQKDTEDKMMCNCLAQRKRREGVSCQKKPAEKARNTQKVQEKYRAESSKSSCHCNPEPYFQLQRQGDAPLDEISYSLSREDFFKSVPSQRIFLKLSQSQVLQEAVALTQRVATTHLFSQWSKCLRFRLLETPRDVTAERKSNTERSKEYRHKIKEDPVKFEKYCRYYTAKNLLDRQKPLTDQERQVRREQNRLRQRKFRDKHKTFKADSKCPKLSIKTCAKQLQVLDKARLEERRRKWRKNKQAEHQRRSTQKENWNRQKALEYYHRNKVLKK